MREYPTSVNEQHEEHIKNLNPLYHIFEIALKFGQMLKRAVFQVKVKCRSHIRKTNFSQRFTVPVE